MISLSVLLRMRNVSEKIVEKIKKRFSEKIVEKIKTRFPGKKYY